MITLTAAGLVFEAGLKTLAVNESWPAANQDVDLTPVATDKVKEGDCPKHFLYMDNEDPTGSRDTRKNHPSKTVAIWEYRAFMLLKSGDAHLKRTLDDFREKFKNRIRAISLVDPHPQFTLEVEFLRQNLNEGQPIGMIFAIVAMGDYKFAEDE